MIRSSSIRAPLFVAAAAFTCLAAPAVAQSEKEKPVYDDVYYDGYYDDVIVVLPPGVQREDTGERTASGARIQTLTAHRVVSAGDLDLRYDEDVAELHRRIRVTAVDACNEIERASTGVVLTSDGECVRDATRNATADADVLVAYARG